jgi:hypothetical protein
VAIWPTCLTRNIRIEEGLVDQLFNSSEKHPMLREARLPHG